MRNIIKDISKELNIPEDKVEFVVTNFWDSVRYYLSNPLESKQGLLIQNFIKFYIKPYRIKRYLDTLKGKDNPSKSNIEFYKKLLKNYEEGETKHEEKYNKEACS